MTFRIIPPATLATLIALGGPALCQDITATLGGSIQFDAVALAEGTPPPGQSIATGGNFRRLRLNLGGRIGDNWSYQFMPRLESSSLNYLSVGNAYVQYDGLGPLHLRVGAFAASTNMDDATSSYETLFLERAQPADLNRSVASGPGRAAAALFTYDARMFAGIAYTGGAINGAIDSQQAIVARAAWRPWIEEDSGLAVGATITRLFAPPRNGARHEVRLRQRPELNTRMVDMRPVDTGNLDSNSMTLMGLEAAGNMAGLYAQGGVFHTLVDRASPLMDDPAFTGWYLQGSWILTGEARVWQASRGGYGAPDPANTFPENGFGAWEIAARYSDMDLDHQPGMAGTIATAQAIRGGRQGILTLGLNWYPVGHIRLMLDYQHVMVDRLDNGGGDIGARMNLLSLRTQFTF